MERETVFYKAEDACAAGRDSYDILHSAKLLIKYMIMNVIKS